MHDGCGISVTEQGLELRTQLRRVLESPVGLQIFTIRTIQRAGNMAGHGVHRLDLTTIAVRGTRIQHGESRCTQIRQHRICIDRTYRRLAE